MKRIAALVVFVALAVSVRAAIFVARMDGSAVNPSNSSRGGGGAILTVNLSSGAWSLTGAISNLVSGATGAAVHGPAPVGQNADPLFELGHSFEPEGPLDGSGRLTPEEYQWLQDGLMYVSIPTGDYPDGEIRGQFALVPEPGTYAIIAGLGLGAFALYRRRTPSGCPVTPACGGAAATCCAPEPQHPPRRTGCSAT